MDRIYAVKCDRFFIATVRDQMPALRSNVAVLLQTNVITDLLAREFKKVALRLTGRFSFFAFFRCRPAVAFEEADCEAARHCKV